ncbi:ATP-binding protein [Candidatus Pacearchaeota archaeon]|nr:ATP-binding protein [Candidatus Pacearchaeota archaeon]
MSYNIILGRDKADKKRFGDAGLVYLGKSYVTMGAYTSLSNSLYLDVARSHVILVAGKRGSGKSYTLGVITEEIANLPPEVSRNIAPLIFDTMGIFWTMKYKNEKEKYQLAEWKLEPMSSPVKVFAPFGKMKEYQDKGIPIDKPFALKASELDAEDWVITFNLSMTSQEGVLITNTINQLKKESNDFTLKDVIKQINNTHETNQETKNIVKSLFQAAENWGIFSITNEGTEITDLVNAGITTIIDLSVYSSIGAFNVRGLVIGLVSKKLFTQRINARKQEEIQSIQHGIDYMSYNPIRNTPLIWLFLDEAHEFLPKHYKTPATDALVQILREGRQPGISLVLATQQPGQIHEDVMTQSDIIISHRVTAKPDIDALNQIMQTYLLDNIKTSLDNLPSSKGSAIILDDNSERIYPMRIRPRLTWHGGESPAAVKGQSNI